MTDTTKLSEAIKELPDDAMINDWALRTTGKDLQALNRQSEIEAEVKVLREALDEAREVLAGWLIGVEYDESLKAYDIIDKALAADLRKIEQPIDGKEME